MKMYPNFGQIPALKFFVKKTRNKNFKNPKIDFKIKPKIPSRVDQLVIKYFSTQGRPDPMGGLYCFLCSNKT
jgi:hypothetical protein